MIQNVLVADICVKPQRSLGSDLTASVSGLVNNVSAEAANASQESLLAGMDRVSSDFLLKYIG